MLKIMAFVVAGMFLLCARASADQVDNAADVLNACVYRIGLSLVGYQVNPVTVRETVTKVCANQIEMVISALIPPNPNGAISIDVEGYEREKAAHSHVAKFLIDDFMKNYQSSLRLVRL